MAECLITGLPDGTMALECTECSLSAFFRDSPLMTLTEVIEIWNDHLKECHNGD